MVSKVSTMSIICIFLQATLARLPDRGANIEKKIQDLTAELEEAELEAAKKESLAKLDIAAMSDVLSKLSMGH
jgi:hypothetical protein